MTYLPRFFEFGLILLIWLPNLFAEPFIAESIIFDGGICWRRRHPFFWCVCLNLLIGLLMHDINRLPNINVQIAFCRRHFQWSWHPAIILKSEPYRLKISVLRRFSFGLRRHLWYVFSSCSRLVSSIDELATYHLDELGLAGLLEFFWLDTLVLKICHGEA